MEVVQHGKNKYALGLQWTNLGAEKIDAEAVSISEERSLPYGVVIHSHPARGNNSQVGLTDDVIAKGKIAGAALIALHDKNVIHVEQLNDGMYWLCAVANHEVIGGYDKILSYEFLIQELDDVYSFLANVLDETVLRIPDDIAEATSVEVDDYVSFEGLIQNLESGKLKKELSKYLIVSMRKLPRSLFLFVGFVGVCTVGGFLLFGGEKEVVLPNDYNLVDTAPVTVQSVATSNKEATQDELLEKAREEELSWLKKEFESQDPVKVNNSVVHFVASIPHVIGGWELKGVRYDRDNPRLAEVAWSNLGNGTSLTLKKTLGNSAGSYEFDLGGDRAKSYHNVISRSERNYNNYRNIIEYISNNKYNHDEMMHDLQSLQYKWEMAFHAVTPRPVKISGIKDPGLASQRQLDLNIKDFKISGSGIASLQTINLILERAGAALIRRIEITNNNGIQWTVIGELYEN